MTKWLASLASNDGHWYKFTVIYSDLGLQILMPVNSSAQIGLCATSVKVHSYFYIHVFSNLHTDLTSEFSYTFAI